MGMNEKTCNPGTVYLIGAGPGDPGLITVKGKDLLRRCRAVIYDNLVPLELIITLPPDVKKYYVGKKAGSHRVSQEQINELILTLAREHECVARLKGSDPLIFGRGGEEAKFLKEHGIPFEIVNGVTSGIAAPCYAGIPCTDRHLASFVLFVTGHKAGEKYKTTVPWEWVADAKGGTIVIFMGVGEIAAIVERLIDNGMSPDTPAAVIERATFPSQRTFASSLREMPNTIAAHEVQSPALFVIGEVVSLRPWLDWFSGRPLAGIRVMVTRPADQAVNLYENLRLMGAEPLPYPTIATEYRDDPDGWDAFENSLDSGGWLVFTSENGVHYFFDRLTARMDDIRRLAKFRIAVGGAGTAEALATYHLKPDFVPSRATVDDLAAEMTARVDMNGAVVIRVRGNLAGPVIEERFAEAGARVTPLTVYRTYHPDWPDGFKEKLFAFPPQAILFTSASSVEGLGHNLSGEELKQLTSNADIFSLGPMVSRTLREHGLEPTRQADEFTIPGLLAALLNYYTKA